MLIYITNHFLVYPNIFCKNTSTEEKDPIPHIFNFVSFLVCAET